MEGSFLVLGWLVWLCHGGMTLCSEVVAKQFSLTMSCAEVMQQSCSQLADLPRLNNRQIAMKNAAIQPPPGRGEQMGPLSPVRYSPFHRGRRSSPHGDERASASAFSFISKSSMMRRPLLHRERRSSKEDNDDNLPGVGTFQHEASEEDDATQEESRTSFSVSIIRKNSLANRLTPTSGDRSSPSPLKKPPSQAAERLNPLRITHHYFEGKTSDEVDQHFSRALSSNTSNEGISSPMSKRNFPPSFWNSDHQFTFPSASKPGSASDAVLSLNHLSAISPLLQARCGSGGYGVTTNGVLSASFSSNLNPLQVPAGFPGLRDIHHSVSAATAAVLASRRSSNPWSAYAGHTPSVSGQNLFVPRGSPAAAPGLYGLSAGQSFDLQYNSLLMHQASVLKGSSFPTAPGCANSAGLWTTPRYSGLRF